MRLPLTTMFLSMSPFPWVCLLSAVCLLFCSSPGILRFPLLHVLFVLHVFFILGAFHVLLLFLSPASLCRSIRLFHDVLHPPFFHSWGFMWIPPVQKRPLLFCELGELHAHALFFVYTFRPLFVTILLQSSTLSLASISRVELSLVYPAMTAAPCIMNTWVWSCATKTLLFASACGLWIFGFPSYIMLSSLTLIVLPINGFMRWL